MIPDSGRYAGLKRAARARTALKHGQTWPEIPAALRTDPSILRHSWARHYVSRWTLKLALGSEVPLSTLQELCAQMKEATSDPASVAGGSGRPSQSCGRRPRPPLRVRPARQREAAYAATRAVALAPSLLVGGAPHAPGHERRGALAPIIVRGAVAFFGESARSSETT
jgi:hypothetical protein